MVNLIFVIILALTAVFTITPQFHILQQNSYFNVRFFDYLKENLKISSVVSVGLCAVCVTLWFLNAVLATVAVGITGLVRVLHAVYKTKTAKKKIVYTGRVKRMYFTSILVSALIILICLISPIASVIALSAVVAFIPFYAMAVNIINAPVEWSMRQWYINDAKRILKEHTPIYSNMIYQAKHINDFLLGNDYISFLNPVTSDVESEIKSEWNGEYRNYFSFDVYESGMVCVLTSGQFLPIETAGFVKHTALSDTGYIRKYNPPWNTYHNDDLNYMYTKYIHVEEREKKTVNLPNAAWYDLNKWGYFVVFMK